MPLIVAGLVLLPFSPSIDLAAGAVLAFFVGYYLYYPPYRALYADLLPRALYARAQAGQAIARGAGLGAALLAGGLLLSVWRPLVFLIGATVVVATTVALLPVFQLQSHCGNKVLPYEAASLRELVLSNGKLRMFALVNALWEFSFAGLKSFIVLYVVRGLGRSPAVASAVIAVVAVAYVAGAPIAGRLADRYGIVRTLRWTSVVYGVGLLVGSIPHTLTPLLVALPVVALAGAIVLTLPQALAFTLAPAGSEGAAAGIQDFSRGAGVVLGPVAVGAAVGAAHGVFTATHGYAVMWLVIGLPVLLAALLLSSEPLESVPAASDGRRATRMPMPTRGDVGRRSFDQSPEMCSSPLAGRTVFTNAKLFTFGCGNAGKPCRCGNGVRPAARGSRGRCCRGGNACPLPRRLAQRTDGTRRPAQPRSPGLQDRGRPQ